MINNKGDSILNQPVGAEYYIDGSFYKLKTKGDRTQVFVWDGFDWMSSTAKPHTILAHDNDKLSPSREHRPAVFEDK